MTPEAAASCDPDYGWINGPDGTNKCYYILRDQVLSFDLTLFMTIKEQNKTKSIIDTIASYNQCY